jgi:hypothetical protein
LLGVGQEQGISISDEHKSEKENEGSQFTFFVNSSNTLRINGICLKRVPTMIHLWLSLM